MEIKNFKKIMVLIVGLIVVFILVGCAGNNSDKIKISEMSKNIEEALKEKDADLFMENISSNYSDPNGGTYDNHINNLPEEIFSKMEDAEDLIDFWGIFNIKPNVTIPESDLILADLYASGKMTIEITLEACIAWVICTDLYNENIEYNVDFQKEDDDWKIISLIEI
jgi:hypothetical protein